MLLQIISKIFEKLNDVDKKIEDPFNISISNILNINIPYYFLIKLEELNAVLGQKQIEVINNTINIIETDKNYDKIKQLQRINIQMH